MLLHVSSSGHQLDLATGTFVRAMSASAMSAADAAAAQASAAQGVEPEQQWAVLDGEGSSAGEEEFGERAV